ncbi:hypothetical protein D3C84_857080 [compost metagenome]
MPKNPSAANCSPCFTLGLTSGIPARARNASSAILANRNRRLAANIGARASARIRPATKVPPQIMVTMASFR